MSDPVPAPAVTAPPPVTRREIFGWCMYDAADSPFTTVIVTALFPLYFGTIVVGEKGTADALWGRASAVSMLIVAVLAPILGAVADFSGTRKRFLGASATMLVCFTAALVLVGPGQRMLGFWLFVGANIGFVAGGTFIDSFLPGISTPANAGRISGCKWGLGYISGLVSLVLCLPLARHIKPDWTPADANTARWIPLVIAGYYTVAVLPTFWFLRERSVPQVLPPGTTYLSVGFRQLFRTFKELRRYRELVKLFIAFLVYNEGVSTVILFAARYAQETVGFDAGDITIMFIGLNVISCIGALSFGVLADRIGQKRTILISLGIWVAAVTLGFAVPTKPAFFVVAGLAGIGIGSCQSVTRSLVALFTPPEKAGEFFGFLGVAGKAIAFTGPLMFGEISRLSGSQRPALLAIGAFFLVGAVLLTRVDEAAGKAAARAPHVA